LELAAALAAIVAAAEADGVVHAELQPSVVRVGAAGVAIEDFGVVYGDPAGRAPEGRADLYVGGDGPPDWRLRQRYGLGLVCRDLLANVDVAEVRAMVNALLAKAPRDRPSPDQARRVFEGATGEGESLSQWCDTPARLRFERRTPSKIAA